MQQSWDYSRNERFQQPPGWLMTVDHYADLLQDFFLLPQAFSNIWWKIEGKPLGKLFYMGLTLVRVMVHVYDFIRWTECSI